MHDLDGIALDDTGAPVLLAGGEPSKEVPTASGNPSHGVSSGRFGRRPARSNPKPKPAIEQRGREGFKKQPPGQAPPPDPATSETRRRDAIVDAARKLNDLTPDGVREFMTRRWAGRRAMTEEDVQEFSRLALQQRVDDLTDALDSRMMRLVNGRKASSSSLTLEPPRGWVKRTLGSLDDGDIQSVFLRLRARGWSAADLTRNIIKPFAAGKEINIPALRLDGGETD
jgi:hypothetical protein